MSFDVHSLPMCNLVSRCRKLPNIRFHQTTFRSCKFFKLCPRNRLEKGQQCCYNGAMSHKQLNAFLQSIREAAMERSVTLGTCTEIMYTLEQVQERLDNSPEADQTNIGQAILDTI